MNKMRFLGAVGAAVAIAAVVTACGDKTTRSTGWEFSRNMYDPIGYNPDQPNANFKDGKTAQVPPPGTVPVGFERFEYAGTNEDYERAGAEVVNPLARTEANLAQGKALYLVYCAVCHGPEGAGDGPITKDRRLESKTESRALENYPPPPSYRRSDGANSSRGGLMADLTDGKIYHTITYGLNMMGSHASQLSPEERWKVVMYVRELQQK
ncbi:Cytochrome C oxidase, cbb3-type, subunit III [Parapedobacter composti]|uniref:Cytochrome C oxidase, cbb3-type, subunit III n=2 Tax=Parapedobacter composti TaxID=623281 RepID=A0A1I1E8F4_9SPHI|nr:Cytochrome C oxidase, cbb3-type, subunit III [Parapedobacter composti]